MKHLIIFLLLFNIAKAQNVRVATITSGGVIVPTASSVDSAKRAMRTQQASSDSALSMRIAVLERSAVFLRQGTLDSLNRLNVLLNELSTRIAQQGASQSAMNATLAGNIATDNSQALQISELAKKVSEYGVVIPQMQSEIKATKDANGLTQGVVDALKNYIRALP